MKKLLLVILIVVASVVTLAPAQKGVKGGRVVQGHTTSR